MRRPAGLPEQRIGWLTARADYLALQQGQRWVTPFFVVQTRPFESENFEYRVGFTASRKVGGAVVRNRARRRLRELVRLYLPQLMRPGHEMVLVARTAAAEAPFEKMRDTLGWAIRKMDLAAEQEGTEK